MLSIWVQSLFTLTEILAEQLFVTREGELGRFSSLRPIFLSPSILLPFAHSVLSSF